MNKYGAVKDKFDERDWKIGGFLIKNAPKLPEIIDRSDRLTPIRDQGDEPACVAFAACAMKEYQEFNEGVFSPRYLYKKIKQPQGGSYPRDAMKILQSEGVPPEECNPYLPQVPTRECPEAKKLAYPNRIKGYARLNTIQEMKQSLFENGPFVAAFFINQSWEDTRDGIVLGSGAIIGGHAILICGYDDQKQQFKFKNSWGTSWGDNGYGYINYNDAQKSLMDSWSSVDVEESKEDLPVKSWWQTLIEQIISIFKRK